MDLRFFESIDELPEDVTDLWTQESSANFFLAPWWFETVLRAGLDLKDRPAIGVLRDREGAPCGIIPARFVRRFLGPLRICELQALTGIYSCYFRPITRGGESNSEAAEALGSQLAHALPRGQIIHFDSLDAEWPALRAFERGLGKAGLKVERYDHFGNWVEMLDGRSFDQYLAGRDGALREIIRRKQSSLDRQERADYQIVADADQLVEGLDIYEAVYARSWKIPEPYPRFHPKLLQNAARAGALRLGICRIDRVPVAVQIWILWNRVATVLKLAHDETAKRFSVGSLLTAHMIKHLVDEEGVTKIDFGRGDDAYKARWAAHRRQRLGILAARPISPMGFTVIARQTISRWRRKYQRKPE